MPDITQVTGVILAGGQNRRMKGRNKAFIEVEGRPIVERQAELLTGLFARNLVVSRDPSAFAHLGVDSVTDLWPGRGSLVGVCSALAWAETPYVFITACDMPYLDRETVLRQLSLSQHHDVIIPQVGKHVEPLHSIYHQRCLPHLESLLERGEMQILQLFNYVRVYRWSDEEWFGARPKLFLNLNTPRDLAAITEQG